MLPSPSRKKPELNRAAARYFHVAARLGRSLQATDRLSRCFGALQSDPGDEVVVLTPAWPNLAAIPTLLGASVRRVPSELKGDRFALDLDRLNDLLTAKTRAVMLNSPNNPISWSIPADDLRALVDLLDHRGIWLIADGAERHRLVNPVSGFTT